MVKNETKGGRDSQGKKTGKKKHPPKYRVESKERREGDIKIKLREEQKTEIG